MIRQHILLTYPFEEISKHFTEALLSKIVCGKSVNLKEVQAFFITKCNLKKKSKLF
ncbi:hypothetical protein LEP1GSC075_1559 [Leptospira interrogans str. Kito]|nr:hypothetical protein LEP1GSC069_1243 [Leptospira interrogans serovar Canicola str. Fiocruz LV133]EMK18980.1 hypothetical protein LEP1GSC075_1559 [Leptospira interrogans str. Kito]EMN78382.1 hypothetical protein LEP1GSC102_1545 [Leptospira interrogans str. UI 09600]